MKYVLDSNKMKKVDTCTIEEIGIPSMVLMEKAAMSVAAVIIQRQQKSDRILAVCGMGNNGGDGVAVARMLKEQGYQVTVTLLGDKTRMSEQMKQQLGIAENLGVDIINNGNPVEYNVIIDAVFGIGLSKPVVGKFAEMIGRINDSENTVYAVDIPSGISADNGHVMNIAVKADATITFGYSKIGLLLYPGCEYAGDITVADIGFPKLALSSVKPDTFIYDETDFQKLPVRKNYSNKGTYGRVLVIAGSKNMSGACILSAKAAYRSGAGLVKVLTVEENRTIIQTSLPEALLCTYDTSCIRDISETENILREINWATAIVVGPGMGLSEASDYLLDMVLQHTKVPVVVDADAITMLTNKVLPKNAILTPHLKEMSRWVNRDVSEIKDNLISIAVDTARQKGIVLALKDARTIVTDGERIYLNVTGNNGMATGGSGDVLTGIIGAFLAQGLSKFEAASMGVFIHGLAGDYAQKQSNCYSLMAGDLIDALAQVLDHNMLDKNVM